MLLAELTRCLELTEPGQRVLVIEDNLPWLYRLSDFWREAGHEVVALAGIRHVEGSAAVGMAPDLVSIVPVDLGSFDAAFLDYYFFGERHNGGTLTRALRAAGCERILGMSSDAQANATMAALGATATMRKSDFMRLLGL